MLTLSSGNKYYSEKEYESVLNRNRLLLADIETISNALRDEAIQRDWCSDYNQFIDDVNDNLKVTELKSLDKDYEVEIKVTRTQSATITVSVTATSPDSAEAYINSLTFDEVIEQCDEHEYNIDWDNDDEEYQVEYIRSIGE